MAFWGIELKPGKPFNFRFDKARGRLHISQACFGMFGSGARSVVQCTVKGSSPIALCTLSLGKIEFCALDLEFEEDVVFEVGGVSSVFLSGFYRGNCRCRDGGRDEGPTVGLHRK
ncbi:hypothetical protein BVC80_1827g39 [Macleaya cordata]|uniref:Nucleoplasmin-like domain-containing protein n=1 Tax=Macleaya cordata TaxID=56857 RepID=A0A200QB89_MACCD|nr:hypothetical protein BVC80_1827g39 [Macleaya cordata]